MSIQTADDPTKTVACPECNAAGRVYERQTIVSDPYVCHGCGATFDEPVIRDVIGERQCRIRAIEGHGRTPVLCGSCDHVKGVAGDPEDAAGSTFECAECGANNIIPTPGGA